MGTPAIDPIAATFDRVAPVYERSRPGYPADALAHLTRTLHLGPGRVVVELGAGSGKLTRDLLMTRSTVVPIEPLAGMRAEYRRAVPNAPVPIEGTAEAIPLAARSADAIVAAQAFHWFKTEEALDEMARVLRPGGGVGLVWNRRDESVAWVHEVTKRIDALDPGVPRSRDRRWKAAFDRHPAFTPLTLTSFRHVQRGDVATIVDRFLSVSFVARAPEADRLELAARIREILARDPTTAGRAIVELPYDTDVYTCDRRPDGAV